jgi:hypothetical protein
MSNIPPNCPNLPDTWELYVDETSSPIRPLTLFQVSMLTPASEYFNGADMGNALSIFGISDDRYQ